jgi:hypothetical protein
MRSLTSEEYRADVFVLISDATLAPSIQHTTFVRSRGYQQSRFFLLRRFTDTAQEVL